MLTLTDIRANRDEIEKALTKRGLEAGDTLDQILAEDEKRRATQAELDNTLAESNSLSKEIGNLYKQGKRDEAEVMKSRTGELKERSQELKDQQANIEEALTQLLYQLPNSPDELVPAGLTENDNEVVNELGDKPNLHEGAAPHWDLADKYDLIDFDLGSKVSGAGFPFYKGKGARLQRALIQFFLDEANEAGYTEYIPPFVVNEASGIGTGQLPDKEGQMYHATADDLYLIPTAEVPLTNIFRDVILKEAELPQKLCGYSPCFRREAGSYGKDVRGLNRLHQFEKVEIVQVVHPDNSAAILDEMVAHVVGLLKKLELPFRTLRLCGGDLSFASAITYDMEVWSAAQERWLEVSSISNFKTFQTNRLKCRYKGGDGKTHLAHTLNGSALALPRIVAALLENNQDENGIKVPAVLHKYTGFDRID
ncbi:serine--tRNA ligase [Sanyastnella coralliicola]|uniref:serine--tRNA ligase n=1 Tax=Sanyastnella coralliicola TaxID=3069118 RepID=UPI0027B9C278|nr:serine--tRNA ligase [Longitalea sp. SCSIO 12813]